jgi:hypothetical protein
MERVRRIEHKGRSIILIDVTGCDAAEVARLLVEGRRLVATCPPKSALTLTDVTGARFDDTASREAQNNARENAPYVRAATLVGVAGLKKIVYNVVTRASGRDFKVCDSREQALAWLAAQP